jgi:two-component system LytT family response regulator
LLQKQGKLRNPDKIGFANKKNVVNSVISNDCAYIWQSIIKPMLTKTINAIVVDDEKPSREAMVNYLTEFCPDVHVAAECATAQSAFLAIEKHKPQLVFLDIEMPKGSGFDLLRKFKQVTFKVIFVTAFSKYAVDAFRFSATDYLLKPVKVSELVEAVAKVRDELATHNSFDNIGTLLQNFGTANDFEHCLVVPNTHGFAVVKTPSIIMCEAEGYCTHFHIINKPKITSSYNLKYYEALLPINQFMRVHKSFIINKMHIQGYTNQNSILLSDNLNCPLSATHKAVFMQAFKHKKRGHLF